jgi:hypothetical protein
MMCSKSLFICALAVSLYLVLSAAPTGAVVHSYVEDFSSKQYCDTVNTTAWWDTVAGEVKLPPYELTLAGSYDTPDAARAVAISGDYAYVADYSSGLQVIDISDPTAPALAGSYDTPGVAYIVAISGDYAYVADAHMGLRVIDISDPTTPALAGSYIPPDYTFGVAISGDYAYVAANSLGLLAVDISDPTNPALAGSYDTPYAANGVAISGNYAYVADYISGLQVIDISDPTNPALAGSYDTPANATDVAISGDYAYVADNASGLQVIDISDPTNPTPIGSYDTPGGAIGVTISGDYAYVGDGTSGLQVIRIAEPVLPPESAGVDDTSDNTYGGVIAGDHAYVVTAARLAVFDISTPESPTLAGSYDTPGTAVDVAVEGNYAYIADSGSGLLVVDISDPTNPLYGGGLSVGWAKYLTVQGNYAYVCIDYSGSGFKVIDISDPTNPTLVGSLTYGVGFGPVAVDGDWAYAAAGVTLISVDISNPTSPVLGGTYVTPGDGIYGITLAGDYAYIADGTYGIHVIDISDPTTLGLAGSYDTPGTAISVALSGDYAYVADWDTDLQVLDISDPTIPTFAASSAVPGNSRTIAVAGDYAFVGAHPGLHVLQIFQRAMILADNVGQSIDVSSYADDVLEARLTTAQNDTVTWEMSADGGSNWQAVTPGGAWNQIAFTGNDFLWRSTHTPVNLRSNPTCTSLQFDFLFEFPQIDTIEDIANDQGRQVRITWLRSANDFVGSTTPIIEYAVYREIDDDLLISGGTGGDARKLQSSPFYPAGDWDFIATVPACAEDEYAIVVPTLADSTISEGMYYTTFFVRALTDTPGIYLDSPVDSGYSVDNLAPAAPLNLEMASPTDLVWEESGAEDFDYFTVYGSATPEFDETAVLVGYTIGITMDVTGDHYDYYHVTATDFSGNEGDASSVDNTYAWIPDMEGLPTVFALKEIRPNPFAQSTAVRFDVPRTSDLCIKIYGAEGRLVKILTQGKTDPGRHAVTWKGIDSGSSPVSPGIYFIKMEAAGFTATRKVALLR